MIFKNPLQYLLVKRLQISKKEALQLIENKAISVNDYLVNENIIVTENDKIYYHNQCLNEGKN